VSQAFDTDMRGLYLPGLNRITYLLRQVEGTPAYSRLLAIGGVTHVVALHPEAGYGLQLVGEVEGYLRARVRVFLTHNPLPRTYVVGAARSGGDTDALRWLLDPAFRPEAEVVLAEPVREPGQAGPAGTSRIGEYRPDAVRLEVSLDRPGFVVLLEGFEPGWQARLDGRKVPLLRANVAFRAVQAPAGRHEITFVYRPPSLLAGLAISAASLVVGCALLARARAARVPTQGASQSSEALAMTTRPDTGS
jgi:hypothetical protein